MPLPFIKFYFRDWEADLQLMECSLQAQQVWLRMMRVMHEAEPYGFFVSREGGPVDISAFARKVGILPRVLRRLIAELETHSVFSRDPEGRIYSRRMLRDYAKSIAGVEFGKEGAAFATLGRDTGGEGTPGGEGAHPSPEAGPGGPIRQKFRDSDSDSLRSSAIGFGGWPHEIGKLRSLALLFIAEFANCRDPVKAEKHIGPFASALATMRARGANIEQGWQACIDARDACGGRPLWGASIKTALSFLPSRFGRSTPESADDYFHRNRL